MGQITHPTLGSPCAMVTPTAELVTTTFSNGIGPYIIDKSTFAYPTIEYEHHEIHDGDFFHIGSGFILASNETHNKLLITPTGSKWVHFYSNIQASAETAFNIFEGGTYSGGVVITSYNKNRNSADTCGCTWRKNCVVSGTTPTSGTFIYNSLFGTGRNSGGGARGQNEWVLKSGTSYLLEIVSKANANNISFEIDYYMHTDKEKQF